MSFSSRYYLARCLCARLPPLIGQRVRAWIFPETLARSHNIPFVTRAQTGSLFSGVLADFHAYRFCFQGYFDWRNVAVALALAKQGDVIWEVGANVGTETVSFRDIVGPSGEVHAFEPYPPNVTALRHLVELNNWQNVYVHACALERSNGTVSFRLPSDPFASGTGHVVKRLYGECVSIQVDMYTLDHMAQILSLPRLIFIDVEGYELEIIQGGQRLLGEYQPIVVLEASPKLLERTGADVVSLWNSLSNLGYSVYVIGRVGLRWLRDKRGISHLASNWVGFPSKDAQALARQVSKMIALCGFLPCLAGVNPLRKN